VLVGLTLVALVSADLPRIVSRRCNLARRFFAVIARKSSAAFTETRRAVGGPGGTAYYFHRESTLRLELSNRSCQAWAALAVRSAGDP
jgi:hypothetical protein